MALTQKPGPAQSIALVGQLPEFPFRLPDEVKDRFPEMQQWETSAGDWWNRLSDLLQRDRSNIQSQFLADESAASVSAQSILASITTIQTQLAGLIAGSGGTSLAAQVALLTQQLQNLLAALAAHIASDITHKTSSPIVGTQDAQDLDFKRIGLTAAGYGRFRPLVGMNYIGATESFTIGASDYMVVPSTFTVYGNLVVDGTLLVV